ncbi:MAG: PD40 domain-containing protein [Nanoarchaeota archaeon]|nr:PD40 domain-containing protein [Nanoarchaeota archaeon]
MASKKRPIWKTITRTAAAGLLALNLLGCPPPINPPKPVTTEQNNLSENTHVLSTDETSSISSVSDNSITVSNASSYYINEIVVADITPQTPDGLFRKVSYVSGGMVHTVPATLEEAVKNVSFETSRSITFRLSNMPRLILNLFNFNQPIDNFILYSLNGDEDINNALLLNGNVSLDSNLYLSFDIGESVLDKFIFKSTSNDSVSLQLTSNLEKPDINIKKDFKEYKLPSVRLGYFPTTPPLPIIVTPAVTPTGSIGGNISVSAGANVTQSASLGIGLSYDSGKWSPIQKFTNSFSYNPPTISSINSVKAALGPMIHFRFYNVAGPYAGINAYLKLDSNQDSGKLLGGLEFLLGVEGKIFGLKFADYSTNIPGTEMQLASWEKPTPPTPPEILEKILFVMSYPSIPPSSPDYPQIYSVSSDSSSLTKVSNFSQFFGEFNPSLSSDGKKISYTSKQNGNLDIYIMNSDGTQVTQLTSDPADDFDSDLSPDGTKIAFVTNRDKNYLYKLYIMNSDGSNQTEVTNAYNLVNSPRWSSDGKKIIFSSYDGLYITEGSSLRQKIPGTSSYDSSPSFSPDGKEILFVSRRGGNPEVYMMSSDGSNPVNLTNNSAVDFDPSFSPDGKRVAFISYRGDGWPKLYVMNKDGSEVTAVHTMDYTYSSSPRYYPNN